MSDAKELQTTHGGDLQESLRLTVENIMPLIEPGRHFATIDGRVEPTRDLALMLFHSFRLSVDTELQGSGDEYIVKATAWTGDGRKASGLGSCGRGEKKGQHGAHDALATAETRAMKRAIEALAGGPVINQLIEHIHGGFDKPKQRNATPKQGNGKKKDPKRQQIIDDIVAVLKDDVFDDADRQHFKDTVGELRTYQELTDHLIATQQERDRRKQSADLDATAAKAFDDTDAERSQAEVQLPDSEPVDTELEEAKTDGGGLF